MNLQILKKPFSAISILFFLLLIFPSCSERKKRIEKESHTQIIRTCIQSAPYTLNPSDAFNCLSQRIIYSLFEGLTRIGPDQKAYPAIAKSIDISQDKTVYTIALKKAFWSNGEPISAKDFAYAWKKVIAKESNSQLCNLFYCIKHAKEIKEGKLAVEKLGVTVIDDSTLRIELAHPTPYFSYLLSNPIFAPLCRKVDAKDPQWATKEGAHFVCNGPFRLKKKKEDSLFILEKNPFYHDKEVVQLDELHFYVINDSNSAFLMYEKGEIDWYGDLLANIGPEVTCKLVEQEDLVFSPFASINWLICNTQRFPLNSKKIRQAISALIDRQNFVDHFEIGQTAASSIVPDMLTKLKKEDLLEKKSLAQAKRLFEEGLRELNTTQDQLPPLRFTYTTISGTAKPFLQYLQETLEKNIGIETTLECCDLNVYLDRLKKGNYDMAPLGWTSYLPDAIYHLQAFEIDSENNWSFWKHQKFQDLLNYAEAEEDETKRDDYLRQAEKILIEELPVIPLSYRKSKHLKNETVQNIVITDLGGIDFKWAYLKKPS